MNARFQFTAMALVFTTATLVAANSFAQTITTVRQLDTGSNSYVVPSAPKLGISASTAYDSLEVRSISYNSPAERLGLETGDRILEINGHHVHSQENLADVLIEATRSHQGQVRVKIDNVRARRGEYGAQRFVIAETWLDGYEAYAKPVIFHGVDGGYEHVDSTFGG